MIDWINRIHVGDCRDLLKKMAADGVRVQTCITSPPYFGLRDYGHANQIGLELTPDGYVGQLVDVFRAVRDVLADDGTLWLNLGDSYGSTGGDSYSGFNSRWHGTESKGKQDAISGSFPSGLARETGLRPKNLLGIPWRVAFALQADGWYLRSDIIWHKPNAMPESVRDRPTKAHEYLFLLAKSDRYYFDSPSFSERALQPDGRPAQVAQHKRAALQSLSRSTLGTNQGAVTRNRRTVWSVPTQPFSGAHFACLPPALIEPCILAGSRSGDIVLDPFMGSGTVAQVADSLGRRFIGCELNPEYAAMYGRDRPAQIGVPL